MINIEAKFKTNSAFQVTGRQFFILGEILSGVIKIGMLADLSSLGVEKKLSIEAIDLLCIAMKIKHGRMLVWDFRI